MISHCRITLAAPGDAHAIAELSRDVIEYGLHWRWTPERVQKSIGSPVKNVVVARDDGRFAGFGIMQYRDDDAHLELLAVAREVRRQGVASALLRWLEACAVTAGIQAVRAEVRAENPAAREFYRRRGYAEIARLSGYYQGVEDAIRLEKRLGRAAADTHAIEDRD